MPSPARRPSTSSDRAWPGNPDVAVEHLRERVYGTITVLASILTLAAPDYHGEAGTAALTLVLTVVGLWAASLFADLTAHLAVHGEGPHRDERRALLASHREILACAIAPTILVLSTLTGWWELETALRWAAGVQVGTLALVGLLAVRGTRIPLWGRVVVVAGQVGLGLGIVLIKLLAH
ncbi:hypothetical protein [Patulibacter sp. SYSU D01012]|uniref:hypothetical protein n=1 Tax=Patulibacter sp. SYSU D01012 TaxID=2817381 RepID=UPI001B30D4A8|nr:hypothetical protein [Patulibacter sp. SYSU D01012]